MSPSEGSFEQADLELAEEALTALPFSDLGDETYRELFDEALTWLWLTRRTSENSTGAEETRDEKQNILRRHLLDYLRKEIWHQAKRRMLESPKGEDCVPFEVWLFFLSGQSAELRPEEVSQQQEELAAELKQRESLLKLILQAGLYHSLLKARGCRELICACQRWAYLQLWITGVPVHEFRDFCPWLSKNSLPQRPLRRAFSQMAEALGEGLRQEICEVTGSGRYDRILAVASLRVDELQQAFLARYPGGLGKLPKAAALEYRRARRAVERERINQQKAEYRARNRATLGTKERERYRRLSEEERRALLDRIQQRIAEDPEAHRRKRRAYTKKNRDAINAARRKLYAAKRDSVNAKRRKKRQTNSEPLSEAESESRRAASRRYYWKNRKRRL